MTHEADAFDGVVTGPQMDISSTDPSEGDGEMVRSSVNRGIRVVISWGASPLATVPDFDIFVVVSLRSFVMVVTMVVIVETVSSSAASTTSGGDGGGEAMTDADAGNTLGALI